MSNWVLHSAKTIGRDHVRSNMVCQDDVKTLEKNGVSIIALSDGCGSEPFSEHGSFVTVNFLCDVFADNFDEIFEKDVEDIKKYLHSKLVEKLSEYILNNKGLVQAYKKNNPEHFNKFVAAWKGFEGVENFYPLTLFAATVQVVATKDGKTVIGRLGDGFIGEVADNKLKILSSEDKNGREGNQTVYPSTVLIGLRKTASALKYFEVIKKENDETDMYFIVSDGMADVIIKDEAIEKRKDIDMPLEPPRLYFNADLIEEILLEDDLNQYLEANKKLKREFKATGDDLSIAILRKEKVSFDKSVVREYDDKMNTIANNKLIPIGRTISNEHVASKIEEIKKEDVIAEEYYPLNNALNLLDEQQVVYIHKLCKDDEEKAGYIISNLSAIKEKLITKKIVLFDEFLEMLKPYVEDEDLVMLLHYGKKIKLLKYDAKSNEISLNGKK